MKSKINEYAFCGILSAGLIFIIIIVLSSYIYLLRFLYTEKFARDFFNDLYDHSQYSIAQSYRGINDASVYQVVGDRLVRGVSGVFNIDPQVPPLGKTIIGISINTFGNAYLQNIVVFILLLVGVYLLGWQTLDSHIKRTIFVFLVLCDSIIVSQLKITMLDLMSTLIIVWFCNIFLFSQKRNPRNISYKFSVFLSGLLLGLLASVKFGLITPILIFAAILSNNTPSTIFSIKELKRYIKNRLNITALLLFLLTIGSITGFILGHLSYFFEQNSSLIGFIKNEKWVFNYWLEGAHTSQNRFVIILSIFTGLYKHFTVGANWQWIFEDWNPIWGLGLISWGILVKKYLTDKLYVRKELIFIIFVTMIIMTAYSVMPFYFRYITHISPFLILGIMLLPFEKIGLTKSKLTILTIFVFSLLSIKNLFLFFEQPHGILEDYERLTKQKLYKDVYEKLTPENKSNISLDSFWDGLYSAEYGLGKHNTNINRLENPKITMPWDSHIFVPYRKVYITELGEIKVNYNLELVRIGHNWKIKWNNEYVHPDYAFGDKFVAEYDLSVKYGVIIDKNGAVKYKREPSLYAIIYPDKIKDETTIVSFFEKYMGLSQFRLEEKYKVNFPSHLAAEIGYFPDSHPKIEAIPIGVKVVYMDRWVGNSESVNTDELGVQGGKIFLVKRNGLKKFILEKKTIQGRDIYL